MLSIYTPHTHICMVLRKKKLTAFSFPELQLPIGIQFLQVNAQYPSRLTKLIMIKCFLGRLKLCNWYLSQNIWRLFTYNTKGYLLLV